MSDQADFAEFTTVYFAYDDVDQLLYVGITGRSLSRLHQHALSSAWWVYCERIELEHTTTRATAEAIERDAIAERQPLFNTRHRTIPA